jgi:hypothetical protein
MLIAITVIVFHTIPSIYMHQLTIKCFLSMQADINLTKFVATANATCSIFAMHDSDSSHKLGYRPSRFIQYKGFVVLSSLPTAVENPSTNRSPGPTRATA